jgi:enterochelin esterase-like enzyme
VRRKAAIVAIGAAAALAAGGAFARETAHNAATTVDTSFRSKALDSRIHFLIHLPAGYRASGKRYPVVYFLHGLPAGPAAYRSVAWVAAALDATGRAAILVIPQGARRAHGDPEYHDWGPGHNWETALAVELPAYVDAHYRTIASRDGRAMVGLSAGGYGATILGVHHLARFGAIESWSGYFRPTDPTGQTTLDVGNDADNAYASVHRLVPQLAKQLRRYPTFIAFYVGKDDPTFVADNEQLDRELTAARIRHDFDLYPGGHTNALWQAHARRWLELALTHLRASA